jgi:C1A family cysteine protease
MLASLLPACGQPGMGGLPASMFDAAEQAQAVGAHGLGCDLKGLPVMTDDGASPIEAAAALPSKVDLRAGCSPVRNQGRTESCVAFATAGGLGEYLAHKQGKSLTLSPRFLWAMLRKHEGTLGKNSGTQPYDAAKIADEIGFVPEAAFPMTVGITESDAGWAGVLSVTPDASLLSQARTFRPFHGWQQVTSVHGLKKSLASGMPVVFGTVVFPSLFAVGANGVLPMPQANEKTAGGHALLCVGYDNTARRFIIRNSWGAAWGDHGYFYMPYDYVHAGYVYGGFTTQ